MLEGEYCKVGWIYLTVADYCNPSVINLVQNGIEQHYKLDILQLILHIDAWDYPVCGRGKKITVI